MLTVSKVDVWVGTVEDKVGGLLPALEALAKAEANLEFLLARRSEELPGKGILFLFPLSGEREIAAAERLGLRRNDGMNCVRVIGPDEPGAAYLIIRALAADGLNLRGVSAVVLSGQFVMYLALDTAEDAARAAQRLQRPM